ncbi:MAG TPA: hypothetical protein VG273_01545 [Bryobacteraceae bacterium]|jgi:hypothetical protein|nr:hypothetical protein [Bryobacteraceae bacterium]
MNRHVTAFVLCFASGFLAPCLIYGDSGELRERAHKFEEAGDSAAAKDAWSQALKSSPGEPAVLTGYGEFLERYRNPEAAAVYRRSAAASKLAGHTEDAAAATRRAFLLDLIVGNREAAKSDLAEFRALGGTGLQLPESQAGTQKRETITIPGPLRSFARMAAISQDLEPDELLPALARNIVLNGYQTTRGSEELEETEFLKLIHRYLSQARELDKLAGPEKVIKVPACEAPATNDLLRVLGFRMRGGCGSEVVLETVNAPRAFVTTDSGFPVADLEQALRTDKPFSYDYHPTVVPVMYGPDYWITAKEKREGEFIDAFLGDPGLCRFYLGMTKLDPETADALRKSTTPVRLRAFSNVLDFFGGNFEIRDGKAVVPGGQRSASAWADLAGASPDKGAEFFEKLMVKDDGWLASLYDALARIRGPAQSYLTDPVRMKRLYTAVRGRVTTPGPARPVFRSNAEMMLLTARLQIDPDGRAHIPGGLEVWKDLFQRNPRGKYDAKLSKAAATWKDPDDVIEALFGLCRKPVDNEPLNIFMALTDIDRNRAQPLSTPTVQRLVRGFAIYGAQYQIFNDVPSLTEKTIVAWLDQAETLDKVRDQLFRQDLIGTMQGLTGIWQIFCRQGSLPAAKADEILADLIAPFAAVRNERELFDAGRTGVTRLLQVAGEPGGSSQEHMLQLLAGGQKTDDSEARAEVVQQEKRVFDAQKLLSLDLLFDLADNLDKVTKGEKLNAQLASRLASRVADIQLPRSSMTGAERNSLAFGYYVDKHVDDERKVNLRAMIDRAAKDPEKLKDIRGQLAPTLRDTIVGFNYAHYAPPGAQILLTNPLFVRGHDFIGMQGANHSWRTTELFGMGWPSNAGGRLVGSLAGLPYALAEAEQNFLIPTQTQALIWGDLVPQMMLTARTPRFWNVTPAQMHWVGLNMRHAESVIAEAAAVPSKREALAQAVNRVASPYRASVIMRSVGSGEVRDAIERLTPSELYLIAESTPGGDGPSAAEIGHLRALVPQQVSPTAISHAWGSPKPTLTNSYRPELLNMRTFPTLMGYSSRIMAESWESNLLYWADVGDQTGVQPAQLNVLVPEWTEKVVERIFASHLEDWPALLKSLRSVGDEIHAESVRASMAIGGVATATP